MKKLFTVLCLISVVTCTVSTAQAYNMTAEEAYKLEQMKKQKQMDDYYKAMEILNNAGKTNTTKTTTKQTSQQKFYQQQADLKEQQAELERQKAELEEQRAKIEAKNQSVPNKLIDGLMDVGISKLKSW